ncbi:3'-5' exonuclease [Blastomonas sp.]|uniref:3'-5' exonuclease n=1 Tax=Blastomonas sp. TaxID=1909299 RepID=UPI0035934332
MTNTEKPTPLPGEDERTRLLHRIQPLSDWPTIDDPVEPLTVVAAIDVETDGLDSTEDFVIQIAVALIEVDAQGRIVRIIGKGQGTQDRGRPLPLRIKTLTGLTDEALAGTQIDVPKLTAFTGRAQAILAHNAGFDSGFCRRLLPGIAHLPWICSFRDVDWQQHGFDGAKLGHLLMQQGLFAPTAHNAMADVEATINLLASELPNGKTVIAEALETARTPTVRVDAENAPYAQKGELKRRGYRFDWGKKVWWIEVCEEQAIYEVSWLQRTMPKVRPVQTPVTWHNRHC